MRPCSALSDWFPTIVALTALAILPCLAGCASTAMETHQKGMESLAEKDYVVPKKPVDRHYIGRAWSKQFGPVEDPGAPEIRVKVERSFNTVQQNFAYNLGVSLGGQSTKVAMGETATVGAPVGSQLLTGAKVEAGVEAGKADRSQLEDVQIISPVSLAEVPFELNIPYITEALRLGNFALKSEMAGKAGVSAVVSAAQAGAKGAVEGGAATAGDGLVVAYKLHVIDPQSYAKVDSGNLALDLEKTIDIPRANVFARAAVRAIEPGAKQPLPQNLLWACDRANAKAKDMVAAWIVDLRSTDPRRKSLQIAFPAFPKLDDCQSFSAVIYARIDPLTDKIIRQKLSIVVMHDELSDALKPKAWDARMSLVEESFKLKLVRQSDLGD